VNTEKWDAFAEAFARGDVTPANGWTEWEAQAVREADTIRGALPHHVGTLVEVGCGIGRLTPQLALRFSTIIAMDTSTACRRVTRNRCRAHRNVLVVPPDDRRVEGDAALVWGNLYDSDWSYAETREHREMLRGRFPIVLEGNEGRWARYERNAIYLDRGEITFTTFEP